MSLRVPCTRSARARRHPRMRPQCVRVGVRARAEWRVFCRGRNCAVTRTRTRASLAEAEAKDNMRGAPDDGPPVSYPPHPRTAIRGADVEYRPRVDLLGGARSALGRLVGGWAAARW